MIARLAADVLVAAHFAFIGFAFCGGLLALKWRRAAAFHLPCAAWGALVEFNGWMCPLTGLEQRLREAAGEAGYAGGFVDHYITPVVYPEGLTRSMQLGLGALVLAVNLAVYARVLAGRLGRKRGESSRPGDG